MISERARVCEELAHCSLCDLQHVCGLDRAAHNTWLLGQRLSVMRRRVLVLSNKGGVGKTMVAVNLGAALAERGLQVGIADADLTGPNVPHLLGLEGTRAQAGPIGLQPPLAAGVKVFSTGFMIEPADSTLARDSSREDLLAQLLGGVGWGSLDLLLVDMPPGTGAELVGLARLDRELTGCILVTTPHSLAQADARRAVRALDEMDVPLLGVVENMTGMHDDRGSAPATPFPGAMFAASIDAPLLGQIPFDVEAVNATERGEPVVRLAPRSPAGRAFKKTAEALAAKLAF